MSIAKCARKTVPTSSASSRERSFRAGRGYPGAAFAASLAIVVGGCATQGDLLRIEEDVAALKRTSRPGADSTGQRIAQLAADFDVLRQEMRDLQGELELARKEAADALAEVRKTRTAVAQQQAAGGAGAAASDYVGGAAGSDSSATSSGSGANAGAVIRGGGDVTDAGAPPAQDGSPEDEISTYQRALDAWKGDDHKGCIDRFTGFLQVYPSSSYADDAAYWLADCTFSARDYKRAVVRFNTVVSVYPESPKAPDALYRQGESLLKLGPKFHEAARTVFKRVQKDYPESPRASEAKRQLDSLGKKPA